MRLKVVPKVHRQQPRPLVVLDGGTGDILLWIPASICVSLMIAAMILTTAPPQAPVPALRSTHSSAPAMPTSP